MLSLASNLKQVGTVVGGCNAAGYILTASLETHKLTDLVGVGSFVAATASLSVKNGLFGTANGLVLSRLLLVNVGIMIWGARLATHLFTRVLKLGEDKRLQKYYRKPGEAYFDRKGANFPINLSVFWILQALWGFLLLLPVTFLNSTPAVNAASAALIDKGASPVTALLKLLPFISLYAALIIEATADYQKNRYRDDPKNDGHWCDVGLYSVSRYPNYFAEILTWWSVYFACIPVLSPTLAVISLISPLFCSLLILKVSGVPLLEKKSQKAYGQNPEYIRYVENTNKFVPLPRLFGNGKKELSTTTKKSK